MLIKTANIEIEILSYGLHMQFRQKGFWWCWRSGSYELVTNGGQE